MPRLIAFMLAFASCAAGAQDYPAKPIIIVVPAAAGGPTDTLTRVLASAMGNAMKTQFVIENAGGAGGIIGINKAAKARADGYTLLLYHIGMSTAPALYRKLPYDTLADFEYIGQVADVPTLDEQGLKGFDLFVWNGLFAPKGTPKAAIDKLVPALQAAVQDSAFRSRLAELGAEPVPVAKATPDSLRTLLKAEVDKWTPIIRKSGVFAD